MTVHEIGHSFELGRADDDFWEAALKDGEIYSGSSADDTKERLERNGNIMTGWSEMRKGWAGRLVFTYNGTTYFTYSLEELSTIDP